MSVLFYDTSAILETEEFGPFSEHCIVPKVMYEL